MDFHIDKKTGLLLAATFVLGGIVGGLAGVVAGHEGREFRDFRGRGDFPMTFNGCFGESASAESFGPGRDYLRRVEQQNGGATGVRVQGRAELVQPSILASTTPVQ